MGYEIAGGLGVKMAAPEREVFVHGRRRLLPDDGPGDRHRGPGAHQAHDRARPEPRLRVDRRAVGVARLAALRHALPLPQPETGALDGDKLPVDLAANAASLGARRPDRARRSTSSRRRSRRRAPRERTTVVHVETDPLVPAPSSEAWWDVPSPTSPSSRARARRARRTSAQADPADPPRTATEGGDPVSTVQLRTIQHRIGGEETAGGRPAPRRSGTPPPAEQQAEVLLAEPADVDAAVQAAKAAFETWGDVSVGAPRARSCSPSASSSTSTRDELARIISSEHGKVVDDAQGRGHPRDGGRRVRVRDAAAAQGRVLRPGLHRRRRLLVPPAARRVRGHHAVQLPDHGPDVDAPDGDRDAEHVRAQAVRARPVRVELRRRALRRGGPARTACSTSSTATRSRSTRCSTTPTSPRSRFVGSTPIAKYVHERATAHGKRVQALGGAKNHAVVMPDADLDFAANHLTAAGYGSAGQRCMAISVAVAVGDAADPLVERLRSQGARGQGRARAWIRRRRWARSSRRRRATGSSATSARASTRAPTPVVDGRELEIDGDGFFVGPTLFDNVHDRHVDLHGRDLRPGARASCAWTRSTRRSSSSTRTRYANGTAIFTVQRPGRAHLPARGPGRA